ncbi:unnamed protein product [Brassica rapa]|uniref:Uncharacterized protein n=1 Tax=Brassica campestris TaxID=3711 RepID=A0A8D9HYM7_BRACM|nr:unnamed protein product [Brassica rapa]
MSDDRFKDSSLSSMRSLVTLENCLFSMFFYCHDENRLKVTHLKVEVFVFIYRGDVCKVIVCLM